MTRSLTWTTLAAAVASAVSAAMLYQVESHAQIRGVKCFGIAKAGQNDCAHAAGIHLCAGESLVDYDGGDWKLVSNAAACEKSGGKTKPVEGRGDDPPKDPAR